MMHLKPLPKQQVVLDYSRDHNQWEIDDVVFGTGHVVGRVRPVLYSMLNTSISLPVILAVFSSNKKCEEFARTMDKFLGRTL